MMWWLLALLIVIECFAVYPPPKTGRHSSLPYVSGDTFRNFADHIFDETKETLDVSAIKPGDIVFTTPYYFDQFFAHYYSRIENPFILISHNGDPSAPGKYSRYLDDGKIIAWFGQNPDIVHEKFYPVPIGLPNYHHAHGRTELHKRALRRCSKKLRSKLLYSNINVSTYPAERTRVVRLFNHKKFCTTLLNPTNTFHYLTHLGEHKFCLSPRGNGLDCHRTWEALIMGCIPIVRTSVLDPIYDGLPVVIVNDWTEINEAFLNEMYERITTKGYSLEKLNAEYWFECIRAVQKDFLGEA